MGRITNYRTDPDLCEILVRRSFETMVWMRKKGVSFQPPYGRQAFKVDGKFKFWGGLAGETWGGGPGLIELEHKACEQEGIPIHYETPAISLIDDDGGVNGVRAKPGAHGRDPREGGRARLRRLRVATPKCARAISARPGTSPKCAARATTPASASRWRSPIGALPYGHWSGCHAVGWDQNAPPFGDLDGRRQFPEAQLSAGHHGQRQRRALRRRGRGFPQLHLRQVRRGDPGPAAACSPGRSSTRRCSTCCATNTASSRVTKVRANTLEDLVRSWKASTPSVPGDDQGLQQGGADRRAVQSRDQGRPRHRGLTVPKPTGRTCSTSRRSKPTRSPAASPSPSAA